MSGCLKSYSKVRSFRAHVHSKHLSIIKHQEEEGRAERNAEGDGICIEPITDHAIDDIKDNTSRVMKFLLNLKENCSCTEKASETIMMEFENMLQS